MNYRDRDFNIWFDVTLQLRKLKKKHGVQAIL